MIFICVGLHLWIPRVPFPLTQSWEMCSWAFSRARSKASVRSVCSLVALGVV